VTQASFSPQQCKNNRDKGQFFITIAMKKVIQTSFCHHSTVKTPVTQASAYYH
jgi:hypothetical protein